MMTIGDETEQSVAHTSRLAARMGMPAFEAEYAVVAPVHLRGAEKIAETFQVKRETVKRWWRDGAPIAVIGATYCAEYNALMGWLCRKG